MYSVLIVATNLPVLASFEFDFEGEYKRARLYSVLIVAINLIASAQVLKLHCHNTIG